jgi:hypothetical protein
VDEQVPAVGRGRHLVDEQLSDGTRPWPVGQSEIQRTLNLSAQLLRLVFGAPVAGRVVRRPGECLRELRVYERRPSAAALMAWFHKLPCWRHAHTGFCRAHEECALNSVVG